MTRLKEFIEDNESGKEAWRTSSQIISEREQAKQIIDNLPEYKIGNILLFLKGVQFDDDMEDDLYCEKLVQDYMNNPDPGKAETITLEELAKREGIGLCN